MLVENGATKFSKGFIPEAQRLMMQMKGLELICGDPRGIKAYGLTYAIASRGGDHLRAEPYIGEYSTQSFPIGNASGFEIEAARLE
ncbi:MAG: hypothetical protein GY866_18025 [Proteobacteria bacterium]|nr:hypothetical protein [Pseudomonadota bacterium]